MRTLSLLIATVVSFVLSGTATAAEGTFDSNGVKIRYVVEGQGEAIVLIHGWMSDSSMWGQDATTGETKLTPLEGFQAIALDCRGHGKSDKPHEKEKYGAEMAKDVVRLLDHLKIKKAHLVGYSMGAFIAGRVAATHPDRVLSIVYGGQAPLLTGRPAASGPGETEIFAKAVEEGKGLGTYLLSVIPPDRPKPTLEMANAITEQMFKGKDVKAFAAAGLSLGALEVKAEDLAKCKVPSLFIYGSKEPDSLKERVAALQKMLDRCEVKAVEGADHMTALTKPEFGATIVRFLQANKGASDRLARR